MQQIKASSGLAANLCAWIHAACTYQEVARQFLPRMEMVRLAEDRMLSAGQDLQRVLDELDGYQRDLDKMQVCVGLPKSQEPSED